MDVPSLKKWMLKHYFDSLLDVPLFALLVSDLVAAAPPNLSLRFSANCLSRNVIPRPLLFILIHISFQVLSAFRTG